MDQRGQHSAGAESAMTPPLGAAAGPRGSLESRGESCPIADLGGGRRRSWALLGWPAAMALAAPLLAWGAHAVLGRQIAPGAVSGWLWCLVGAPLLEEAIFRWGLQESLTQALGRAVGRQGSWLAHGAANLLASLAFVISHQPSLSLVGRLDLLVPSLALGLLWSQRRQYWLCVGMHAWFNLCLAGISGLH